MCHAMCSLEAPNCNDMVVIMQDEGGQIEPSFEMPVRLEPLPVEGELQYQSLNDAIVQDCGLAGGTTYVTRDGGVGCAPALHGDPTYEQWLSNYAPPGFEVEDSPEPPYVDGEPQYQPPNDAWVEDCNLAGRLAYVTSDGVFGCVVAHDLKDSGEELVSSSQPPTVIPQPEPAS